MPAAGLLPGQLGMMRGSGDFLLRSVRELVPVVKLIAAEPPSTWNLNVHSYADQADEALALGRRVRKAFTISASDILVTKTRNWTPTGRRA